MISKKIGKEVEIQTVPFVQMVGMEEEKSVEGMFRLKGDLHSKDAAQRMSLYYNYGRLFGSTNVLRWVLRRETTG